MKRTALLLVLLGCLGLVHLSVLAQAPPPAPAHRFVVIVHESNPTTSIDAKGLAKIFLKKVKRWDHADGQIEAYDLPEKSEVREDFTRKVHGKSVSAIKSYWQRMIFSGRDVPPDELDDDAAMMATVASSQVAVGYVSSTTKLIEGVKVLEVTDLED